MRYIILKYTYDKAKALGVDIKNSTNPKKKIDVFKNGIKIASIGSISYSDYPTYIKTKGKEYADQRRRLYKLRHSKDRSVPNSPGWWSDNLLW